MRKGLTLIALALFGSVAAIMAASVLPEKVVDNPSGLVIHEWGTFTSLQNENGESIGGINTDDEPVPAFVHGIFTPITIGTTSELPPRYAAGPKGILSQPILDISMRLETPVIYFHLPPGVSRANVDVSVTFKGGLLTQFYPLETTSDSSPADNLWTGKVDGSTQGTLRWKNTLLGGTGKMPETNDPVWTSPRHVASAPVTVQTPKLQGTPEEHEQFIFYRGVGHLDAPLRVTGDRDALNLSGNLAQDAGALTVSAAWLADIREDGKLAFQPIGPLKLQGHDAIKQITRKFVESDYSTSAIAGLRQNVKEALQHDGMNSDEAEALLATWEHSYFKTSGLRLLFMVPQAWTDRVLPLTTSAPNATVKRAMVGRIEIVTPQQRAIIQKIKAGPFGGAEWLTSLSEKINKDMDIAAKMRGGRLPLSNLGLTPPADYQAYLSLGRFRQALLLDAQRHGTTPALDAFINAYQLAEFAPKQPM